MPKALELDTTMTNFRMALLDLLRKDEQGADPQFLRDGLQQVAAQDAANRVLFVERWNDDA
jgi:hypothetical protein